MDYEGEGIFRRLLSVNVRTVPKPSVGSTAMPNDELSHSTDTAFSMLRRG